MSKKTPRRRVILIGLDGLMPEQVEQYADRIPGLRRLLREGFFAPALSSPTTDTATNWTTIPTGAWTGTHGCLGFHAHLPGMALGETTPTFNSRLCRAEYFWQAAERQGKRCILINYPKAFPRTLRDGVVVGGDGLQSADWTVRWPEYITSHLGRATVTKRLHLGAPGGWRGVPADWTPLREGLVHLDDQERFGWSAAGITAAGRTESGRSEPRYVLVFREGRTTKVLLARSRDARRALAVLQEGQWSGWVPERFGNRPCYRQYKLLTCSRDGRHVTLYGSMAAVRHGWAHPRGIEREIIEHAGPYVEALETTPDAGLVHDWFGEDTAEEILRMQARWVADCAAYLARREDWDVLFAQYHAPDGQNHMYLRDLEHRNPKVRARADRVFEHTLQILLEMVERIRKSCADENTVLCVVSDHGNMPITRHVNGHGMMLREGWTRWRHNRSSGRWDLDDRRSKAVWIGDQSGIWLNVRGREKHGCVRPGAEYERLRSEIVHRLRAVTDPKTGADVFALVARREDLASLGLWGERVPDVMAFARPYYLFFAPGHAGMSDDLMAYTRDAPQVGPLEPAIRAGVIRRLGAVHWHLPTASCGYGSTRAACLLSGPGVARGRRSAGINLVDVAPTLAHLLGIEPPKHCEGRVVHQALTD